MLKPDPLRPFPDWHPRARELGAPRFFIFDTEEMEPLIEALRDAPLEDPESPLSKMPGEAVDEEWEHRTGHAHAMLRYGLMSRPPASPEPEQIPEDPRARFLYEVEKRRDSSTGTDRYDWSS
jgi:hypothetical protein